MYDNIHCLKYKYHIQSEIQIRGILSVNKQLSHAMRKCVFVISDLKPASSATETSYIIERGSSKSAHAWIFIIFCMLNTYVLTTTKMKLFHSSKVFRPQGGTLMYTLFVLIYDLLNISLKSLTLLTATFFEWNMIEDFPGYTLLPLMYMNTPK